MFRRFAIPHDLEAIYDEDTGPLFASAEILVDHPRDHPFVVAERAGWDASVRAGATMVHVERGVPVGFAAMSVVDGAPYLDQLGVTRCDGRGGGGGLAIASPAASSGSTRTATSDGTAVLRAARLRPGARDRLTAEMRAIVDDQRATLPRPDQRVVMCRR